MILDKHIEIVGNGKTLNYYINLGYDIKCNKKIFVKIEDLIKTSSIKLDCYCDICGSLNNIKYYNYIGNILRNEIYRCNECAKLVRIDKIRDIFSNYELKKEIVKKTKDTNIEKYGVDSYTKTNEYLEKSKHTCFCKYGVDNPMKSEFIKNLLKNSIRERYGVNFYFKTCEFKKKYKITCNNKYGVNNVFQSEIIKYKIKETCIRKYGVDNPTKNVDIFNKAQRHSYKIYKHNKLDIVYQGTYELDFINYCIENNIIFERGPVIDYNLNGKDRKYYSDFYIPNKNLICEIKSNWTYKKDVIENEAKMIYSIKSGYNFIFIIDKNYEELKKRIS